MYAHAKQKVPAAVCMWVRCIRTICRRSPPYTCADPHVGAVRMYVGMYVGMHVGMHVGAEGAHLGESEAVARADVVVERARRYEREGAQEDEQA